MSGWRIHYLDARGRQAESTHPSKEAAISQVELVLRQRSRIQRIEGPNGEVIDREIFEREHLKKPSGHRRPF
jgi:hypothetical protein